MKLILGSASPRRLELLAQANITPDSINPANIDETPRRRELPFEYCQRMALEKANSLSITKGEIILTADTTVSVGRRILGTPADVNEAETFLNLLSGRRHKVITAITGRTSTDVKVTSVVSQVKFKRLSINEINLYLKSKEWEGKAGGYAIQGLGSEFIPWISGSYSGIVGLPLSQTISLLKSLGWKQ